MDARHSVASQVSGCFWPAEVMRPCILECKLWVQQIDAKIAFALQGTVRSVLGRVDVAGALLSMRATSASLSRFDMLVP
eukprot:scaffold313959_cov40-Tisochrysis_lutea.AAC.3